MKPNPNKERSFFQRLTGSIRLNNEDDLDDFDTDDAKPESKPSRVIPDTENEDEGQLSVDVYQTDGAIFIQAMVAGVKPEDLDVSITREIVTLRGHRDDMRGVPHENFFHQELYWGAFSRTILLPQEVEPDLAEASQRHGLLTIRLPIIDKGRTQKLKVKIG